MLYILFVKSIEINLKIREKKIKLIRQSNHQFNHSFFFVIHIVLWNERCNLIYKFAFASMINWDIM